MVFLKRFLVAPQRETTPLTPTLPTRALPIHPIGRPVSILRNSTAGFASSLLVLDYTNSTFLFALYNVIFNLPFVVVPLIAGPYLDRFSRKKAIYTRYKEGLKDLPVSMNP